MSHSSIWTETCLGALGVWGSGGTPKSSEASFYGGGVPWIRSGDLPNGPVQAAAVTITEAGVKNSSAKWVPTGSVLIAMYGATIGKLGITTFPVTTNQAVAYCIPDTTKITVEFLFWLLLANRTRLLELGQGGAQPNISQTILKNYRVSFPPLSAQRHIVAKLQEVFVASRNAREELNRVPKLVERYRQAVLATAFRGELTAEWRTENPQSIWSEDDRRFIVERRRSYVAGRRGSRLRDAPPLRANEAPEDLPASWISGCLADVADLRMGYAFKSSWFSKTGTRLLRGANIAPGRITWNDVKFLSSDYTADYQDYRLSVGDIVIAMDRSLISSGLKVAVVEAQDDGCLLVQRVASPACTPCVDPRYLLLLLNSNLFIAHVRRHATGSDLPHLSGNDIQIAPLPIPPLEEQREIVRKVSAALAATDVINVKQKRASGLLPRLEQSVLAKVLSGELVIAPEVSITNQGA